MDTARAKRQARLRRHVRVRRRISGTADRPRLAVFRSNRQIYAQLIDDTTGRTLASATSLAAAADDKTDAARTVGAEVAAKARQVGIEQAVFDRGGYLYHGRVKALADAARQGGLRF